MFPQVLLINTGTRLTGTVTDQFNHPLPNATISPGHAPNPDGTATTNPDGTYTITIDRDSQTLTVLAPTFAPPFAPQERNVSTAIAGVMNFKLPKGNKLSGRVVDPSGNPLPMLVAIDHWGANRQLRWFTKTDSNRHVEWLEAPKTPVTLRFQKEGFMNTVDTLAPGAAEHTVTLPLGLRVKGAVTDAQTGKPIDTFEIIDGYKLTPQPTIAWESFLPPRWYKSATGSFDHLLNPSSYAGYKICVLAPGYATQESRLLQPKEGSVSIDFKLSPKR